MKVRIRFVRVGIRRLGLVSMLACAGCAAGGASNPASTGGFPAGQGTGTATGAAGSTGAAGEASGAPQTDITGAGGSAPVLQPEKEVESSYKAPVATGHFVWIANPTSGRVAYVDATSLAVSTVEAGDGPTYLTAVPGAEDAVIVLNTLSNDATYLSATGTTLTSRTIPNVAPGSNGWAVSPDGRFALAWTDARLVPAAPETQGFQNVTIIDLQAAAGATASTTIAVGYRPISIAFSSADSSRAFAVTQDGVSVVALAKAAVVDTVPLGENGATDAADTEDVSITPDGKLAIVRRDGSAVVGVVDLASHVRTDFTLSGAVTDIDVSADGMRAVAVVRDTAEVAVLPLAGAAPAAAAVQHVTITGETIGQVTLTAGGLEAVLFSNATPAERLTVLTLGATPTFHVVKLHASVLSALPTPDGMFAVVLHPTVAPVIETPNPDAGAADGGVAADAATSPPPPSTAFSLVPLDGTTPARIEMTNAPIQAVAISPTSDRVLLSVVDDDKQIYGAYLGLLPSLDVGPPYQLASPPTATGVVGGANRGYIAQQYPDGRITFITLDSGAARTLTGYELGARVVEWSE